MLNKDLTNAPPSPLKELNIYFQFKGVVMPFAVGSRTHRICPKCPEGNKIKPISEFYFTDLKTRKKYAHICKTCTNKSRAERQRNYTPEQASYFQKKKRAKKTQKWLQYLSKHPCVDCGEKDVIVLDADHRIQEEKQMAVANMVKRSISWARIQMELNKCDIRCVNCHRKKTQKQLNYWKNDPTRQRNYPLVNPCKSTLKSRKRRIRNQSLVRKYLLNSSCLLCHEDDPDLLEFDHIESNNKKGDISRLVSNAGKQTLIDEIAKCRVLCANCHRLHTAKQLGWYKNLSLVDDNIENYRNKD